MQKDRLLDKKSLKIVNVKDLLNLQGKNALVTGGNRGIGKGIAIALAQAGADITIFARNEKTGREAVAEIEKFGVKSRFFAGDVTISADCNKAVSSVIDQFGKIDILVNNAGIAISDKAENMSWEDWYNVINTNFFGVFLMSQAAGREMIKNKSGSIINISSMSGVIINNPQPQCNYNSAKAAVNHLTKSLAFEWAKHNVRVNAIAPGYIKTGLLYDGGLDPEMVDIWIQSSPMKRIGEIYELGGIAVYLASDASTYTTGSIFIIDGGYTLI